MPSLFEAKELSIDYKLGDVMVPALRKLTFSIQAGKFTCLVGPSGSGKSTLLNVLGFIEPLQCGQLQYFDRQLSGLSESELNKIRRFELGFVFQNFHLIDVLTASENVEYFLARQSASSVCVSRWLQLDLLSILKKDRCR
jgi:putative ABC transport system ATP-binding protein